MAKVDLRRHGGPLALIAVVVAGLALRGSPPPDRPCDGTWVWKTIEEESGCSSNLTHKWECEGASQSRVEPLPLSFEHNAGQAPGEYQFLSRSHSLSILLDGGDADFILRGPDGQPSKLRLHLEGAANGAEAVGEQPLPGLANYFLGRDPNKWLTNLQSFARVRYREVYPGIDVVYYGNKGELEHDFVVKAGADPGRIHFELAGADSVQIESDGGVSATVRGMSVAWELAVLYQNLGGGRRRVQGRYRQNGGTPLSFDIDAYDKGADLVIDPVVSFVSYFGQSGADAAGKIVVDGAGNAYTAGITFDSTFPVTPGAPSVSKGTTGDILITKFNADGSAVLYSTHIGGAYAEGATGIAIDPSGNLYLAGSTNSDDYPVTAGALKPYLQPPGAPNDPFDCVVTKLNGAGNSILYSTYVGGTGKDSCMAIAVDGRGSAYIAGGTVSTNFPVSDDALQRTPRGGSEGFVMKLNPQGTGFEYSTIFGGTNYEMGNAIAVDSQGSAYVAGHTNSSFGFPITAGSAQAAYGGSLRNVGDAFVLKLNPGGSQAVYSTYLGGSREEVALGIAVDGAGSAYVTGLTTSTNFRTTEGAYQREFKGVGGNNIFPGGDVFVVKLNPAGSALVYSTLLGGSRDEWGTSIAVDAGGNAYIAGSTLSPDFPVSQDANQRTFGGTSPTEIFPGGDAFLAQLNSSGSALVYGTYLGGSADELGLGVAVDASGSIYVSGTTLSRNLPVTPGAAQTSYGGTARQATPFGDVFVARFAGSGGNAGSNVELRGMGSAASYAAGGVAPGEIVVLGGGNIGPANLTTLAIGGDGKVSTTLGSTRVLFDGTPAPLIYVSAAQSSAIVPYGVAGRSTTQVVVEYQGQRSAPLTMAVLAAKPALFSANGSGTGLGAILNENLSLNTMANPSQRGRVVVLYGTGVGQTDPPGVDGLLATLNFPRPLVPVSVTIGGRNADVLYAGAAPNQVAGVFQANVKVPEDSPVGNVEVVVTAGSARSQTGLTVAVR